MCCHVSCMYVMCDESCVVMCHVMCHVWQCVICGDVSCVSYVVSCVASSVAMLRTVPFPGMLHGISANNNLLIIEQ